MNTDLEPTLEPTIESVTDVLDGAPSFLQHDFVREDQKPGATLEERRLLRAQAMESQKLRTPSDLSDLADVCQLFARGAGCDAFLFGFFLPVLGSGARFVLNGYPEEWFRRYNEMGYIHIDPVVTRVLERGSPFEWRELEIVSKEVLAFFMDAASFGLCSGFSVRTNTALNGQGALNFSSHDPNWSLGNERREIFGDAMLFAADVADAVFKMLERLAAFKKKTEQLSPRQIEVLDLASRGLQTKQIADALKISVPTAEFHLRNVLDHLEVPNRSAAITFAVQTGLVNCSRPSRLVSHTEYMVSGPHDPSPPTGIRPKLKS